MGWGRRGIAALVGSWCALVAVAGVAVPAHAAASAAGRSRAKPTPSAPPPPLPGWVVDRVHIDPLDPATSPLAVAGVGSYRGSLELARSDGGVGVVDALSLEDYLRGLSEVPVTWPLEAQKAQAVAARTYALYEMGVHTNTASKAIGADLCATDSCQVYAGLAKEQRPGSEAWSAAVDATRGQVLWYRNGPIKAKYSSSNGGRTVPGDEPYLRAVDDPDDAQSPLHHWQVSFPLADVARVIGLSGDAVDVHRQGDDVVATAIVVDEDGTPSTNELTIPAIDFRTRLNNAFPAPAGLPLAVPSVRFAAGTAPDRQVVVDGGGWGHGIGLSQYGALGKALRGMKAPDILAAYYAGLRPVALPPQKLPATIKVAVALDEAAATISAPAADGASGRFRITDSDGHVLASSTSGTWQVLPAPQGKVRVVAPPEETAPPTATLAAVDPVTPAPRRPLRVTVHLDGPTAVTALRLTRPDGATEDIGAPTLRHGGDLPVTLTRTAEPGQYRLEVDRDAGGGRQATSALVVDVPAAVTPATSLTAAVVRDRPDSGEGRRHGPAPVTVALLALAALGGAGAATARAARAARAGR